MTLVLGVLHSLEPGGVERDMLRFAAAWRAQGIDARIALGRREGALQAEAPDIPYIVPEKGALARIETESLWMMLNLPRIVREVRPDVLVFPSNGLMAVAAALRWRLGAACPPMILRISNSLDRSETSRFSRWLHRRLLRAHSHIYAAIVAMAPPLRDEIIREMGAAPDKVVTIHNAALTAADAARLASARDAADRCRPGRHYLAVGRLAPQKNFALLLNAFARIAGPDDRLAIIGEGSERSALERKAAALGIAGRLALPGHSHAVEDWFAQADAFILSSDFEGVPAVLVEALAAGVPIVATDCAVSIPMMVEGAGRLVPPRNLNALADAMVEIVHDRLDVALMRARARRFTLEESIGEWNALFRETARN